MENSTIWHWSWYHSSRDWICNRWMKTFEFRPSKWKINIKKGKNIYKQFRELLSLLPSFLAPFLFHSLKNQFFLMLLVVLLVLMVKTGLKLGQSWRQMKKKIKKTRSEDKSRQKKDQEWRFRQSKKKKTIGSVELVVNPKMFVT